MLKRVTFGSFKSTTISAVPAQESRPKLCEYPPGTLIPPEVLERRVTERASEQSFETLRRKVEAADEERRRKDEMERIAAERRGRLQSHGHDHQLGYLAFKICYDVHREALKVTLIEANHLRPRAPTELVLNVRVSVTIENLRRPGKPLKPKASLGMLSKLAVNRSMDFVQASEHRGAGKTPTADPSSSSVIWKTHKPVWNEDFFFDGIQNRQLKNLVLLFTVIERQTSTPPEAPKEDIIGGVRIPLSKLHKKLAVSVPTNDQEAQAQPQHRPNYDQIDNEEHIYQRDEEIRPPTVEAQLPKGQPKGDDAVARWLAGIVSPIPGQDAEMEELQSLCNSDAVQDLLADPELMDSVSVREMRLYEQESKAQLETIKELARTQPSHEYLNCVDMVDGSMGNEDGSEPELPDDQRPMVIRTLEGWYFINRIPGTRPYYGELEIGMLYEANLGKITVSIIKGKEMVSPDGGFMNVTVSVQKKTRVYKKSTPFSAIAALRSGSKSLNSNNFNGNKNEPVTIGEKAGRIQRTAPRTDTAEPVWEDRFTFNVTKEQLMNVSFDILVYNGENVIGGMRMGYAGMNRAAQHWAKMIKRPGVWATYSYMIQ